MLQVYSVIDNLQKMSKCGKNISDTLTMPSVPL